MSIDPVIRLAESGDREFVIELDAQLRATVEGQRGGAGWLVEHPHIVGMLDVCRLWVAVIEGVVVGFLASRTSRDDRGQVMTVDRVFVHPAARELGCGDALLAACMAEAQRGGYAVLEASALPGDRETKNLYERAGVTARSITLSRDL